MRVAASRAGKLVRLDVAKGASVSPGRPLFELDPEPEASALAEAERKVEAARARLADLRKGMRPTEIASIEARLKQARVSLELAELEFKRASRLRAEDVNSVDDQDRARASRDLYRAQVQELESDLKSAKLGGRQDAIAAAEAEVKAGEAARQQARWNLEQKRVASPVGALVEDTHYRVGEWVPAGRPVVTLLPPGNLKARFFVAQEDVSKFSPGQAVTIRWDGGPAVPARVSYVSRRSEFTPPVIYSRESRAKLVFMVEAQFENPDRDDLRVGQPVEVRRVGP